MTDDAGYGVSGTFGGVIPTPALDRIANMGLRYTQFHSTALCSPTRAALITGRNHHSVGFGVVTEQSTGYPGYDSIIGPDNATVGEILKEKPANTQLTPWPDDLPKWETLDADSKKLFARQAEVFAAYAAYTDNEIGRVIQTVEDLGKLDNTLIIYIEGDNGTSAEGSTIGTPNVMTSYQDIPVAVQEQLKFYDVWGSSKTYPHMSVAWSWAFDTPFKWTKQIASHFGGTRQGMAMAWPNRIKDAGGIRTQFHHMIDIVPTILEAAGIQAPTIVNGIGQKPIEGTSMVYTFDKANANVPSTRTTQYFEMMGNRAIYHDGWIAATTPPQPPWLMGLAKMPNVVNGYKWELYNIADDYSESNDLAAKMPDKLREMQELFLVEAAKYNVFPLDNSVVQRLLAPRPSDTAGRDTFTYSGEMSGLDPASAPSILNRSYTVTADVDVPQGGGDGMLATLGGRFGGYGLYMLKGKVVFLYNFLDLERFRWESQLPIPPGKHTISFDFTTDGPGFGKGGTGVLRVDGSEVANKKIPHTIPFLMALDETFDVGMDTRTPVDDNDYQLPFRFNGKIVKLTYKLGPVQLTSKDHQIIQHALAKARD